MIVATCVTTAGAQPRAPAAQAPLLTERAEIAQEGVVLRFPAGWTLEQDSTALRVIAMPRERMAAADPMTRANATQVRLSVERVTNHAEAMRLLTQIRTSSTAPTTVLTIGGWPAIQQRAVEARPQPGVENETERDADNDAAPPQAAAGNQLPDTQRQQREVPKQLLTPPNMVRVTVAVAAGELLVRADASLLPDAPPAEEAAAVAIARSLTFRAAGNPAAVNRDLEQLRRATPRRPRPAPKPRAVAATSPRERALRPQAQQRRGTARPAAAPMVLAEAGLQLAVSQGSEAEIAVSTNGQNIIITQGFNYVRSTNGGQTFANGVGYTGTTGGDGSIAFGRSGAFYVSTIAGSGLNVYATTDNGATMPLLGAAYTCPAGGGGGTPCGFNSGPPANTPFPDQEHIAADRFNQSATSQDMVYVVWRQGGGQYGIVCSSTGGTTWTPAGAIVFRAGDFPRVAVGSNGRVYVVYRNNNDIALDVYASCANNNNPPALLENQRVVATVGPNNWAGGQTPCSLAMPGLDRCNNGNNLSSFMVAVDDTDPTHVYIAYAQNTSATAPINENIIVQDSVNGGHDWLPARTVTVNGGATARRFMPWICAAGGIGYINWFDRRAATAANDSLTDFFAASATRNAAGNLVAGVERRVNALNSADNQCEAGALPGSVNSWPNSTRAQNDSENCTPQQPQLAGRCFVPGSTPPAGTGTACDFSTGGCPLTATGQTQTCQTGSGVPKYGDYNGNACAAGRFYSIWPSATPPPPAVPAAPITMYFAALVVAAAQIQIPGPVGFPDTCVGTSSITTGNICNTGTNDLHIDPITSSDPQFTAIAPSSGYPVTIAPGSCFPFQIRFTPTSAGDKTATLTVPSDDSVTPKATMIVSGKATQTAIVTMIADAGDFGTVPAGAFHDQPLVINNPGGCPLTVNNITSSAADFQMAQVVTFPFSVAPGASVAIPIRFQPTSFGAKTANLTIVSTDPSTPSRVVPVTGTGGAPHIVTTVVDTASFGPVCVGATRDISITVTNSGTSPLLVSGITSSSPEFQVPQVLTFPIAVAVGTSVEIPIRFAPTTPGSKTATLTIASNDPTAPAKTVTMTGEVPDLEVCHPPSFTALGLGIGPTFGSSSAGSYTVTGSARHLVPFGEDHHYAFQTQGEYLYYKRLREAQIDLGLINRWTFVQFGLFASFENVELDVLKDGGLLGQVAGSVDLLFTSVRVNVFASKGFKDPALVTRDTSFTFPSAPTAGTTIVETNVDHVARVADTLGGGAQVGLAPNTDLEGNIMWLRRARPTPLGDRVGAAIRVNQHVTNQFAVFAELTLNETFVGPTNNGRVLFGFAFGRWTRPSDLKNKHTPLGTDVPRVHFDLRTEPR